MLMQTQDKETVRMQHLLTMEDNDKKQLVQKSLMRVWRALGREIRLDAIVKTITTQVS